MTDNGQDPFDINELNPVEPVTPAGLTASTPVVKTPLELQSESTPETEPQEEKEEEVSLAAIDALSEGTKAHYFGLAKSIYKLPPPVQKEINDLIDRGIITQSVKLRNIVIERNRDGKFKVPVKEAFRGYVLVRQLQNAKAEHARKKLNKVLTEAELNANEPPKLVSRSIYEDLTLSVENKKERLENLVKICEQRIAIIKEMQKQDPTASFEANIIALVREVRQTTETLIKMREDLKSEGDEEVKRYINVKLNAVLQAARQAYVSIHGSEKEELFKTAFKLKLKENNISGLSSNL